MILWAWGQHKCPYKGRREAGGSESEETVLGAGWGSAGPPARECRCLKGTKAKTQILQEEPC